MKNSLHLLVMLICLFCCACTDKQVKDGVTVAMIQSNYSGAEGKAAEILKKSIEYCGGWDAYLGIKGIDYKKTLQKIDSMGTITEVVRQRHRYNLFPEFSVRMDWEEDDKNYTIVNNGNQSAKFQDGNPLDDEYHTKSAYNSSFGSQYVLFQPWKLFDPAAVISYDGKKTIPNGVEVDVVKIDFTEKYSTTTDHTWWYYFAEDGKPIGNFLTSPQGNSYTEYMEFERVDGILFHTKRNAYRSNDDMSELTLRTIYENDDIKLIASHDNKLFDIKG